MPHGTEPRLPNDGRRLGALLGISKSGAEPPTASSEPRRATFDALDGAAAVPSDHIHDAQSDWDDHLAVEES